MGKKIHFIGDSLNGNMADSLQFLGVNRHLITSSRFDDLGQEQDGRNTSTEIANEWKSVLKLIEYKNEDIIVFNAGTHWYTPANVTRRNMQMIAQEASKLVSGHIIYRTAVMGHYGCQNFTNPLGHISPAEQKKIRERFQLENLR